MFKQGENPIIIHNPSLPRHGLNQHKEVDSAMVEIEMTEGQGDSEYEKKSCAYNKIKFSHDRKFEVVQR